jgi:hypothetical protein
MKHFRLAIFLLVLLSLTACEMQKQLRTVSCNKGMPDSYPIGTMCTTDTCATYQSIWKALFMEKNHLTESYFNSHIELSSSSINVWNDGRSFSICYKIKLGWAEAYNCDQFMIKIDKSNQFYPAINLPRDTYLSKDQIRLEIDGNAFSSFITKLSNVESLKFNSLDNAVKILTAKAKVNTLCARIIFVDNTTGNLVLEADAQYDNEVNSCIQGRADLITGATTVSEVPCVFEL